MNQIRWITVTVVAGPKNTAIEKEEGGCAVAKAIEGAVLTDELKVLIHFVKRRVSVVLGFHSCISRRFYNYSTPYLLNNELVISQAKQGRFSWQYYAFPYILSGTCRTKHIVK